MAKNAHKVTPMIQQYLDIKEEYPDAILFFRVGDFYEMFFDDAELAARELEIVLTNRSVDKNDLDPIPLAGVPHHSCEAYIGKLLDKGFKVAICEQVEDPQQAKGIVKREVVQLITPGTVLDSNFLREKEHNYLAALTEGSNYYGIAFVDVSTADFFVTEVSKLDNDKLVDELLTISPKEIVVDRENSRLYKVISKLKHYGIVITEKSQPSYEKSHETLTKQFRVESLEGFGLSEFHSAVVAGGFLMDYLLETQKTTLDHLQAIKPYSTDAYLSMDANTRKNLELCETIRQQRKEGSLLWVLDKTKTAMGGRMMRNWIHHPLLDSNTIQSRQNAIDTLVNDFMLREEIGELLKKVYDLERVIGKIIYDRATPKDLVALSNSLQVLPQIRECLTDSGASLKNIADELPQLDDLVDLISRAIVPDPPATIKEGGLIRDGFDEQLDEIRELSKGGKDWIASLEAKERERTGIKSLKVSYNKVFGYYIEVTKKNTHLVPHEYIRKQTLVNAERYVTPDMKEYEDRILSAEEEIAEREYQLFQNIRAEVVHKVKDIQQSAKLLAELDCHLSLAIAAVEYDYVLPQVDDSDAIEISGGRHPVVERVSQEEPFVPNDTYLDNSTEQIALITGPNMAGKSTYMRQVAIIIIMAQMGSFVPAEKAKIGVVDKIFTRVGAADDLVGGQSTFMVEMNEVANILNNATSNSFVILDEIGRGTSTFDGISIARAVIEYLHQEDKVTCKTLFATHFHELIELADEFPRVVNYSVSVREEGEDMVFLRQIEKGGVDRSYGVQVARLAGIPRKVIGRAKEILHYLENRDTATEIPMTGYQVTLDDLSQEKDKLIETLYNTNPDELSPRQALDMLYELYEQAQKFKD